MEDDVYARDYVSWKNYTKLVLFLLYRKGFLPG